MKVELTKPLCSPEHSYNAGAVADLPKKLAEDLIGAGAAKKHVDPKTAKAAQAAAKSVALEAIDSTLKADIKAVEDQLKKDKVKPGAVVADLTEAAEAVITELKEKAAEAKEAL